MFGDFFNQVGNFVGGLFGGGQKKKREEERPTVQTYNPRANTRPFEVATSPRPVLSVQEPASLVNPQDKTVRPDAVDPRRNLGGVEAPKPKPEEKKDDRPFIEKLGAGLQQAGARAVDTAVQGGSVIERGATIINPFLTEEQRNKRLLQQTAAAEELRSRINSRRDISGNQLVGNRDVDEAAGRIASGRGTAEDVAAVGGRGLDVAGTTTMFINPVRTFGAASAGVQPIKTLVPVVTKEAGLYGGLEGTTATLENYGQTGDLREAINQFAPNFLLGAGSQLGLEGLAYGSGRLVRGVAGRTPFTKSVTRAGEEAASIAERNKPAPIVGDPNATRIDTTVRSIERLDAPVDTPIAKSANIGKPPAITSPNRPNSVNVPEKLTPAKALEAQAPEVGSIKLDTSVPFEAPNAPVAPVRTAEQAALDAKQILDETTVPKAEPLPEATVAPIESPAQVEARVAAEQATPISPEAVAIDAARARAQAPTEAIADDLGSITRKAVAQGELNTPEGISSVIQRTTDAANQEAKRLGTTLDEIIRKGQTAYQESKSAGRDLTTAEAEASVKGFTPDEQALYKNYAQEIGTLRDRSGLSLDGGYQGEWYGPRQTMVKDASGNMISADYNPSLVNEIRRQGRGDKLSVNELDLSSRPYEDAIRRYAENPGASSEILVDAVENKIVKDATGAEVVQATGITVPDTAKQKLEEDLAGVVAQRDEASRLLASGDKEAADSMKEGINKKVDEAFVSFINAIPGSGKARREAINNVKAIRGTYMQSTVQALALSNIANRVADQGMKVSEAARTPVARAIEKVLPDFKGAEGVRVNSLNTSKEARKVAKNYSKGTLRREIADNFKSSMRMAGAGQSNVITKGIAKLDALPRAVGSAITQAGDLSTANVRKALELGASRPEARGLKTEAEYSKYFDEYMQSNAFKQDLNAAVSNTNSRIGLAGSNGDNMNGGGKLSKNISKYVDNGLRTYFNGKGIDNRIVNEANDFIKSNITGYAGVGSRVARYIGDSATLGDFRKAMKVAKTGDPTAIAQAKQLAAQGITDAIAFYGSAAAAAAALGGGLVGYTGVTSGDDRNKSAYNQANNIPDNMWYLNMGDNRVYFDPARPFGAAGVGADLTGAAFTGSDAGTTVANIGGQLYDQTGGSSLPETIVNAKDAYLNSKAPEYQKKYAQGRVSSVLTPNLGVSKNFANATDNKARAPETYVDKIKQQIPGLRKEVPVKKDARGNEIPNSKQLTAGAYYASVGKNPDARPSTTTSPVDAEIARLQKISGDVFPTKQNTNATKSNTQGLASLLMRSGIYTSADDNGKAEYMKKVLAGSTGKDISDNISDADKSALLQYKLLGSKKGDVWLENNQHASDYWNAVYNNAEKRGELSADDKSKASMDSVAYKRSLADVNLKYNVDEQLQSQYTSTGVKAWREMLDPNSDTYDLDLANKLFAYDKARAENGVSAKNGDHSNQKFYGKTSNGGKISSRSGRGGRSSGKFAFASLPSGLVGAGGTGSTAKYADKAPTFEPLADLQAPASVALPSRRNISVKKGIQI